MNDYGSLWPNRSAVAAPAMRMIVPSTTHGLLASAFFSSYPICSPRSA
ncbi:hypothetical protein A4R44_08686 [Amycolatopsis sp. M39]|nr:hypothetical protein A4R44_08686 [Amycolatopsis sp. M39]